MQDAGLQGLKAGSKSDSWWKGREWSHEVRRPSNKETLTPGPKVQPAVKRKQPMHRGMRKESIGSGVAFDPSEAVILADSKRIAKRGQTSRNVKRQCESSTDEAARYEKQPYNKFFFTL